MYEGSPPWLTRAEAAQYLKISIRSVDRLREQSRITPYRLGRAVRYRRRDLDKVLVPR